MFPTAGTFKKASTWSLIAALALVGISIAIIIMMPKEGQAAPVVVENTPAVGPVPSEAAAIITDLDIAMDKVVGMSTIQIMGRNPSVGDETDNNEDIWDGGGYFPPFLRPSERINLATAAEESTAVTINLKGLDTNYNPVEEEITIAQPTTTPVITTQAFSIINSMSVVTDSPGVSKFNASTVTATSATTATKVGVISAAFSTSLLGQYYVPANHDLLVRSVTFSINLAFKTSDATQAETHAMGTFILWVTDSTRKVTTPMLIHGLSNAAGGSMRKDFTTPLSVSGKSRIHTACWAAVGIIDVTATLNAILVAK